MSLESFLTMLLILTVVWGGLILMLVVAIRRERAKARIQDTQ